MKRVALLVAIGLLVAGTPLVAPAAEADRKFGDTPLDDVLYWADQEKACGLGRDQLAALMLAPTWPETGAPVTLAPSPMTMSRWDTSASLGAFGGTEFPRAFWHPGISPWQLDDSGFASAYDAQQRINTYVAASQVARVIKTRWCANPSLAYVWAPWAACRGDACAAVYAEIYDAGAGQLRSLVRDAAVTREGGMEATTCRTASLPDSFPCWRVDPAAAEGARGWTNPNFGPSPVTAPFYVYSEGGVEHRHWLAADTGYAEDISAERPLGQNSRTQLTWGTDDPLCDLSAPSGACCPLLTAGSRCGADIVVDGTYRPASGDFNGDGFGDVLWYAPGATPDLLWMGTALGEFTSRMVAVGSDYEPVVGDFDGDGRDDVFWYGRGSARDYLWYGRTTGFIGQNVNAPGAWTPVAGDFDGDRHFDILWYAPGSAQDYLWHGGNRRFTGQAITVRGANYEPFAGDFDGDGRWDVYWYQPGTGTDVVWWGAGRGVFTSRPLAVDGDYEPVSGRLNLGRRHDILWYGPGTVPDAVWLARAGRTFESFPKVIGGHFQPFAGDFDGDGPDDVFFYGPGAGTDLITHGG